MRIYIALFLLLFADIVFAKDEVYETKLENGLQIIVVRNPKGPVVYHSLWYNVGSADSPSGASGLAHFLEHLMFKGTTKFPQQSFSQTINRIGGTQNAQTSQDATIYWQIVDKQHLPLVMEMEADRMVNLVFDEKVVEKEIDVVLNERRMNIDGSSTGKISQALNAAMFWNDPYGKPVIGYESEIKEYTGQKAKDFYEKWYTPSNAILIVAGDVTLDEVKNLAQKYYGVLPKKDAPLRNRLQEPTHHDITSKIILRDENTRGVFVEWDYFVPNFLSAKNNPEKMKSLVALNLLQIILTDPTYGCLNELLIHQQKLAYATGSSYQGLGVSSGKFAIYFSPELILDVEKIEGIIQGILYDLALNGPKEDQIIKAKERYRLSVEYQKRNLTGLADTLGDIALLGFNYNDYRLYDEILDNLNTKDIKEAVSAHLTKNPAVQLYSYPDRTK